MNEGRERSAEVVDDMTEESKQFHQENLQVCMNDETWSAGDVDDTGEQVVPPGESPGMNE